MYRKGYFILLTLCLLFCFGAMAQSNGETSFVIKTGDSGICQVDFQSNKMFFFNGNEGYVTLIADGMTNLAQGVGMPALPQMSRLLVLPRDAELRLLHWDEENVEVRLLERGSVLVPWQGATVKDAESIPAMPNKETYTTDTFLRWGNPLEVERLGVMGDKQLFRITVHPVAYNPVTGEVAICSHIVATLQTSNYQLPTASSQLPRRYLIVSRPQFRDGLQPFVRWKRQEGYQVEELYADTNRRDSVKALIEEVWGNGVVTPWPQYMLIVGDASKIQAYTGTSRPTGLGTHPTDLYYAEHTGDYLPDVLVGRWPVNDTAELRAVVEKTLQYEQGLGLDSATMSRVLLVAGIENQDPAPVTTNGQVNYLKREIKRTLSNVDTLCYYNPASTGQLAGILSDIRQGTSMLNYTAHCGTSGWSNPAMTFATLDSIATPMPLFYINNCCQSNNFTGTCFGEQLLRKPQGGAIGVIGATNSTLWNEDYYWAVGPKYPFSLEPQYDSLRPGAFDHWLIGEINSAGEMLAAGNLSVSAFGSPHDRFYWEIYCLFGDPSLVPWIGLPQRLQLSVPDTLAVGTTEVHVSGTPGATVTAMQGNELLGTVVLDEHRSALLQMQRPTDTMPVLFTITKPRCLPNSIEAASEWPQGKAVGFYNVTLADTAADFTLTNIGADTIYGVSVTLATADSGDRYASFSADTVLFDTLAPQTSHTLHIPLQIVRWGALLSAYITSIDTYGDSWRLRVDTPLDGELPELSFIVTSSDTTATTILRQGGNYLVGAIPIGVYDTLHFAVTTLPDEQSVEGSERWLPISVGNNATHLRLAGFIGHGNYIRNYDYYINIGHSLEGFGLGMDAYPWNTDGTMPWTVDSTVSHSGRYSLRSGAIEYRQTSSLSIELTLPAADSIGFWLRTSTEQNYDKLTFTIDGTKAFEASGETNWTHYRYALSAGMHTLRWRYVKDESTSSGSDCVWLDDVSLPLALWDTQCSLLSDDGMSGIETPLPRELHPTLFPNPSDGKVTFDANGSKAESIIICDVYGRSVYRADLHNSPLPTPLNLTLPDGIYLVEMLVDGEKTYSKLIIIHP